jgi:hypothetical protein
MPTFTLIDCWWCRHHAILASLLPADRRARCCRSSTCLSQLKQIALATQMGCDDADG